MAKFLDLTGLTTFKTKIQDWATGLFVQKVSGKGLSTNDYTTAEKEKLSGLENPPIKIVKVNGTALSPDASKAVNIDLSAYALSANVTQEIAQAVSGIQGFDAQVVASLPATGAKGVLYLVANSSGEEQNIYDEYLWVTDKYEKLGTRTIDLSGYAKKTEIPKSLSQLTNDSGFQNSAEVASAIAEAIAGYATTEAMNQAISTATNDMATNTSVDNKLKGYAKSSDLPTAITTTEIDEIFASA